MTDNENPKLTGIQMEYSFLRDQFLKRVEMRHQVVELTLTIAAAFLGLALTKEVPTSIALIFPPIAFFLALEWVYIDIRQNQTVRYLRKLEKKMPDLELGWEEFKRKEGGFKYAAVSQGSCFLFTQILAMIIAFLGYEKDINNWAAIIHLPSFFIVFLFIDCICVIFTLIMIWGRTKRHFSIRKS